MKVHFNNLQDLIHKMWGFISFTLSTFNPLIEICFQNCKYVSNEWRFVSFVEILVHQFYI